MSSGPTPSIRELFEHAVTLDKEQRAAFLESMGVLRPELKEELGRLLAAHDEINGFLSETARMETAPGTGTEAAGAERAAQIGAYRVVRELGRGGMGTVFLAVRADDAFSKTVALKVIRADYASEDFVRRFRQERQILAALDHPNITRILDGGTAPTGEPYYVMEYVDGVPIDKYCEQKRLAVNERVALALGLCEAVEYLHNNAIIHRDLKPSNVLVDRDGRVKLLDFGIAKVMTPIPPAGASAADGPTLIMTPGYASPEQLARQPATKASDQYSLAVILYVLLTGRMPFTAADGTPNLAAQVSGALPEAPSASLKKTEGRTTDSGRESRRRAAGDLDRVVLKALDPDPARRYESVGALGRDLRNYLEGKPVAAHPASGMYRLRRFAQRNALVVGLAAALGLAVVIGGGLAVRLYVEGVRIEAKQAELDRVLEILNGRQEGWTRAPGEGGPSVGERVADVKRATQILWEDARALVASGRTDLGRLRRLVDKVVGYLDRAATLGADQPPVLMEVSTGYERAGDLQVITTGQKGWGNRQRAQQEYQKAAAVVATAPGIDPVWLAQRLAHIDRRLGVIGGRLDIGSLSGGSEPPPPAEAAATPPPPVRRETPPAEPTPREAPASPPAAAPSEEMTELVQRLDFALARAGRAKQNLDALRRSLAAQGQAVNAETEAWMSQAESYLQQARSAAGRGDVEETRRSLVQAEYVLGRIFRVVGN